MEEVDPRDSYPRIGQGQALCQWIWVLASTSQIKARSANCQHITVVVMLVTSRGTVESGQKGPNRPISKKTNWAAR